MNILGFSRKFRTARRIREIVNVFIRHGFGNLVDQIHLGKYVSLTKRLSTSASSSFTANTLIKKSRTPSCLRTTSRATSRPLSVMVTIS